MSRSVFKQFRHRLPVGLSLLGLSFLLPSAVLAQSATYNPALLNALPTAPLTTADLNALVCGVTSLDYTGFGSVRNREACNLLTNQANFYSTTPGFYKVNYCSASSGVAPYGYIGNFLALTGDYTGDLPFAYQEQTAPQPSNLLGTVNACNAPGSVFRPPTGFAPRTTSSSVIALGSANSTLTVYGQNRAVTIPQDPNNPTYAEGFIPFGFFVIGAGGQTQVGYQTNSGGNDTATYGTTYGLSTGTSGTNLPASGTLSPLNGNLNYLNVFPVFNPQNHPEMRLSATFTPQSGTTFLGPSTLAGRILALNHSTVSVSAISGQSTLTPGSTSQGFTLTRAGGDQSAALLVSYTIGGTAANGTDYGYLSGTATMPAGQSSLNVPLTVPVPSGSTAVPQKDVLISLTTPADSSYLVPANGTAGQSNDFIIPAYNPSTVSFSQSSGGTLTPGTPQQVTVSRSGGDATKALTIPYTTGGTATSGSDYYALPGSVTIPAGQASTTFPVSSIQQTGSTAVPSKTLTLAPSTGSGYTADPNAAPISYTIPAYTPTAVSAAPGSSGSSIPQGTTGSFTIARTGDLSKALPVTYTLGGTATNGTDYNQLPGSVTIPAGQSSVVVPVTVPVTTGSTATPAKTIQVAVDSGSGYAPDSSSPSTTLTIPAYTPSSVSFGTTNGGPLTPGGTADSFTVTRSGNTTQPLTVSLATAGSATPGVDYGQLPANVTIPAGQTSVTVPLRAFAPSGTTAKPQQDIQISLQPGAGYAPSSSTPATYTIPAYTPTTGSTPAVTVSVPNGKDTLLAPGTSTNGFTVTRTGATTAPLTVGYTVGGTAKSGTDYAPLSGTVTIPAGATSATVPLSVPSSATVGKTVAIDVTPGTGYTQGTNSSVTYTIGSLATAPNTATVSLGFDSAIPAFVLTRAGGDLTKALTVPVNFGGSGVPGVDYAQLPSSVTFPAGKTSATIPVKLLPTAKTGNTIMASIPPGSGYNLGSGDGTSFTVPAGYNDGSNVTATTPTPTATAPTSKKGGVGGATGFLAGAAGLSSIALSSGGLITGGATAVANTVVPNLLAGSTLGTIPQSCSTTGETPIQLAQLLPLLKEANPNWSTSTFASLPAPTKAGSIKLGKSSVSWKAGQPVADIVRVGDTDGTFNLHCLGVAKLASLSQLGLAAKPLSTLNLVADTTLKGLSQSLYRRAKTIGDVKGLAEWIAPKSAGRFTAEQLSGMSVADLLKAEPALASLPLGAVPLNQLPGYSDLLLGDVPSLASKSISQVAGLSNVPFSQFPVQPKPLTALGK